MTNKLFCVGIDLCSEFSQVAYFNYRDTEPVSVDFAEMEQKYQVPTVICKVTGKDEWLAGIDADKCYKSGAGILVNELLEKAAAKNPVKVEDVMVKPIELVKIYLDYLLQIARKAGGSDTIHKVCVTVENFDISILNVISKALEDLGIDKEHYEIISHGECFIFYTLNQKHELFRGDVVLFDYSRHGLTVNRMYTATERGQKIVMIQSDDFSEEIPYSLSKNTASVDLLDERLKDAAQKTMEKHNVTSVFLIGRGFSDDLNLQEFIKYVCNRKRVFAGQNLYAKGACYSASNGLLTNSVRDYLIACAHRITTGIEMKISDRGKDKILRLVRPGINWFSAGCSYDFIVDDMNELEIFLSSVDAKEKQLVRISLEDFPLRPNKTTRVTVSLSFTSDSRCLLMVKDRGFGEFYKSSGSVISEELLL